MADSPAATTTSVCSSCHRELKTKGNRLPRGWKRQGEELFCAACWKQRYILRAITVPLAKPLDIEWPELRTRLQVAWAATTQASNWILTELYAADVKRGDLPKLPPMPGTYFYRRLRDLFPTLPPQSVASIEVAVTQKYKAKRYEIVWTCASSLPTYRYPTPFPISKQSWDVSLEEKEKAPIVRVRLVDGWTRLKLQSGDRFRRQMTAVAQMISGEADRGELALYRQGKDIMCKMVAWLPRPAGQIKRAGSLTVRTTAESLIVAYNLKDEKLWIYNGDQVRRWVEEHRKQLERWSEDSKAEHRPVPPFTDRRHAAVTKHRHRMATTCHQIAEMIVGYAVRRKFEAIVYDDTDHTFVSEFPWFELARKIAEKADAAGVELIHTSGDGTPDASAPAEQVK